MEDVGSAIGFAALCISVSAYYIAKQVMNHRERMAKIEKGIDPDQPKK